MSKEAVVFLLDVSQSMWETEAIPGTPITLLDKAIKCLSLMQSQKIIDGRKTDQVALVLAGSPETDNKFWTYDSNDDAYKHVNVVQEFGPAQYEMIKLLKESLPLGQAGDQADPIDAIVVAADLLIELTKGKAFGSRRIIFLSNFSSENEPHSEGIEQILDQMKGIGISLDLIRLDNDGDGGDSVVLKFLEEKLVNPLEGQIFHIDEALGMLAEFGAKRARQVATFRGTLDLAVLEAEGEGDDSQPAKGLKIPISIFSKTNAGKLPTAKKLDSSGTVERNLEYRRIPNGLEEEETDGGVGPVIPKEKLIQAYRYGKTLVPMNKIDMEVMGYKSEKCLSILGFVAQSSIQRSALMTAVWLVVPDPGNQAAETGLSALVQACWEKEAAILARYVRAKGNSPRLVALIPKIKSSYAGFLMVGLPFAEDLRRFTFPSLASLPASLQPSDDQVEVMKNWINSMQPAPQEDDEVEEDGLKPSQVPNPLNQRLIQCILARVENPGCEIPEADSSLLEKFQSPPPTEAFALVQATFELRKVEKWKHAEITRFWGDEIVPVAEVPVETATLIAEKNPEDSKPTGPKRTLISADKPIEDFEVMVSDRHHDLVVPAFKQLMALIPRFTLKESTIPKAIQCLQAMRVVAIREDEQDLYNAYLQELKRTALTHGEGLEENTVSPAVPLWKALLSDQEVQPSVTLISNAENPASLVSPDHAQTFFQS